MQNLALQVKGLQKSYKQIHVLRGVDFEVEQGIIFALLGSNGAGKTTIVKILATLQKQDGGTAAVNGFDVALKPGSVRQSISLTGQFAAVDGILTGREKHFFSVALTIEVTGWFSAKTRTGSGIEAVGTNAELINGKNF